MVLNASSNNQSHVVIAKSAQIAPKAQVLQILPTPQVQGSFHPTIDKSKIQVKANQSSDLVKAQGKKATTQIVIAAHGVVPQITVTVTMAQPPIAKAIKKQIHLLVKMNHPSF